MISLGLSILDDTPKLLLAVLATVLAVGRLWIYFDRSSMVALALGRCWTPRARRLAPIVIGLAAFGAIAEDVLFLEHDELILRVDRAVTATLTSPALHAGPLAGAVSRLADEAPVLIVAFTLARLVFKKRRTDVLTILIGTATAWGVSATVKVLCRVPHAFAAPAVDSLGADEFPSWRAMVTMVALGTTAWVLGRGRTPLIRFSLRAAAYAFALVAGASWVAMGASGPSDVLGGLTLGGAWLAVVVGEAQSWERARLSRPRRPHRRPVEIEYQSTEAANLYDRRRFASLHGRYNNWRLHRLLNRIVGGLAPGSIVLDIPCGTGRIDGWLLKASLRVIAADVSGEMLAMAQRKFQATPSRPALIRADANQLPFRSRSIDAVCSIRFLHLMDPPERLRILEETARVAKRWIVVEYRNVDRLLQAARRTKIRWLTGEDVRKPKTVSDIADELTRCGLIAERYYFMSRWFSGSVLVVARHHRLSEPREDPPTVPVALRPPGASMAIASAERADHSPMWGSRTRSDRVPARRGTRRVG